MAPPLEAIFPKAVLPTAKFGVASWGWFRMFVASIRIERALDSLIWNDFWMLASRKNCPQESIVRFPNVPICPGRGFKRPYTTFTGLAPGSVKDRGAPAGALTANALRLHKVASDAATTEVSAHWGSRIVK